MSGGEILDGVVEQLAERQREQVAVGVDHQTGGHLLDDGVTVQARLELLHRVDADDRRQLVALAVNREVAGVDAQHLDRVGHERAEAIELFVDDRDQLASFGASAGCARSRSLERSLHRRQRRLELVRQRIEHCRAQLAALARGFGARRGLVRACALQTDGREVGDGVAAPCRSSRRPTSARLPIGAPPSWIAVHDQARRSRSDLGSPRDLAQPGVRPTGLLAIPPHDDEVCARS